MKTRRSEDGNQKARRRENVDIYRELERVKPSFRQGHRTKMQEASGREKDGSRQPDSAMQHHVPVFQ
ncbi:hypothetical protein Trydic_g5821 [Trypoxylus dichotomus]